MQIVCETVWVGDTVFKLKISFFSSRILFAKVQFFFNSWNRVPCMCDRVSKLASGVLPAVCVCVCIHCVILIKPLNQLMMREQFIALSFGLGSFRRWILMVWHTGKHASRIMRLIISLFIFLTFFCCCCFCFATPGGIGAKAKKEKSLNKHLFSSTWGTFTDKSRKCTKLLNVRWLKAFYRFAIFHSFSCLFRALFPILFFLLVFFFFALLYSMATSGWAVVIRSNDLSNYARRLIHTKDAEHIVPCNGRKLILSIQHRRK